MAWRLDEGSFTSASDISEAEGSSRGYFCRVLQLTLLAPDIAERILGGLPMFGLPQLLRPFPVEWERQRQKFCRAQL